MKTHSSLIRLCLASFPAFALTVVAAESGSREKADRPTEQREQREGRREPRPESQAAPREGERTEPRGEARPPGPGSRRPGGEQPGASARRPEGPAIRDGARPGAAPQREGGPRPPMAGPREGGPADERQRHIREAIEHLRLAGLIDVAEHLQQNLSGGDRPREAGRPPQSRREGGPGPAGGRPAIQPPRDEGLPGRAFTPPTAGGPPAELRELHEQVAQLRKMVEELARQRR